MKYILISLIAMVILLSCQGQKENPRVDPETFTALSREWAKVAATGDLEKLLSYWADDAQCLFPGKKPIVGKDSIRAMLMSSKAGSEVSWEPKEAHVSADGDMAYVIGQNYFKIPDSQGNMITIFNKSLEIWKRQSDGSWKCVVDMYNDDPTIKSIR